MSSSARPLRFLFVRSAARNGSTIMRGKQLSDIVRAEFDDRVVRYEVVSPRVRDSDLFFTKNAAKLTPPEAIEKLRGRGNRVFVDVIDEDPPPWADELADCTVAASRASFEELTDRFPHLHVALIDHHVDPRIRFDLGAPEHRPFAAGYFGELFNVMTTPELERRVDFTEVSTSVPDDRWLAVVGNYPLHFSVRRYLQNDRHKPFLKGFTAARVGANIVAERLPEVERWLGTDYPYLTAPEPSEDQVLAVLDRARMDYGTARWNEAVRVGRSTLEAISPQKVAAELRAMLDN